MIHQPSSEASGQASDIAIHAREILRTRSRLNDLYSRYTGKNVADVELKMERDTWMTPEEAVEFGLIDRVLTKR